MKTFLKLIREFCAFNSGALKVLACISPFIFWKFTFPKQYYEMARSGYTDFLIYVVLPFAFVAMIWEFIKFKRNETKSKKSGFDH